MKPPSSHGWRFGPESKPNPGVANVWSIGTICGGLFPKMYRGQICNSLFSLGVFLVAQDLRNATIQVSKAKENYPPGNRSHLEPENRHRRNKRALKKKLFLLLVPRRVFSKLTVLNLKLVKNCSPPIMVQWKMGPWKITLDEKASSFKKKKQTWLFSTLLHQHG